MPRVATKGQDKTTGAVYAALKKAFPELPDQPEAVVYRYNPVAVRVRVVSPRFGGKSTAEREAVVNDVLASLPSVTTDDITMLLLLTPAEAKRPNLLHLEFDDPRNSYL